MKKTQQILLYILICFAVGYSARLFQAGAISDWYPTLIKPIITPPDIIFPIAWGIIYLLMAISIGIVDCDKKVVNRTVKTLFFTQLGLNFLWSISFFYMQNPVLGLINIAALDIVVTSYIYSIYRINKISAWLLAPYAIWLIFATYLNSYIAIYN